MACRPNGASAQSRYANDTPETALYESGHNKRWLNTGSGQ